MSVATKDATIEGHKAWLRLYPDTDAGFDEKHFHVYFKPDTWRPRPKDAFAYVRAAWLDPLNVAPSIPSGLGVGHDRSCLNATRGKKEENTNKVLLPDAPPSVQRDAQVSETCYIPLEGWQKLSDIDYFIKASDIGAKDRFKTVQGHNVVLTKFKKDDDRCLVQGDILDHGDSKTICSCFWDFTGRLVADFGYDNNSKLMDLVIKKISKPEHSEKVCPIARNKCMENGCSCYTAATKLLKQQDTILELKQEILHREKAIEKNKQDAEAYEKRIRDVASNYGSVITSLKSIRTLFASPMSDAEFRVSVNKFVTDELQRWERI